MKFKLVAILGIMSIGTTLAAETGNTVVASKGASSAIVAAKPNLVGGWYPIFFNEYSSEKVNSIIESIKAKRVKRIMISFDQNKNLALKIESAIQSKVNFAIELNENHQQDDTAQYDHNKVVVTIWSK